MSPSRSPVRPSVARPSTRPVDVHPPTRTTQIALTTRIEGTRIAIDSFRRIIRRLRIAAHGVVGETGLTAAQQFVLTLLAQRPAASLHDLAQRTMTDRSSVRALVDRLVEQGLVQCQPAHEDRRRLTFRITPRGKTLLRRAPEPPTALLVRGLDALSDTDMATFATLLARLVGAMGLSDDPPTMLFEADPPVTGTGSSARASSTTPR